jgi:peptide/nickel transport system substrate-binding protein
MQFILKRLLLLAAALTISVGVAACGDDGDGGGGGESGGGGEKKSEIREGGELTFNYPSFPDFLDPALAYTVAGWQAIIPTYTSLTTYRREEGAGGAQLIPGLIEALPEVSEDGKTYTMKLRSGLKYSDGSPVKANDFEHSVKRLITLESGGASFFTSTISGAEEYQKAGKAKGDIKGIEADDQTGEITVELKDANGQFPFILSMPFSAPVPGDTPFEVLTKNPPPGTGPLKITSVDGSRRFVMEKNENYVEIPGLQKAHVDKITVNVVQNNERSIQDVLQNKADWMDDPSAGDALREFKNTAKERYEEPVTNSTYYFFLNQKTKPFDNPEVRKAVHYAIDKRALAKLFGGQLEPGCNFLPPGMQGYEKIEDCPFGDPNAAPDLEKAKQMIKDAGVEGDKVTVWGNTEDQTKKVTEYLESVMKEIGFDAKSQIVDGEVYFQTIGAQKTKAQAGFANWFQDYPHPANFMFLVDPRTIQPTNNQNFGNVDDPEIQKELERLEKLDLSEAAEGYAALDRKLVENADVIPYGHRKLPVFTSERIAFDEKLFHPVLQTDFATFALKK